MNAQETKLSNQKVLTVQSATKSTEQSSLCPVARHDRVNLTLYLSTSLSSENKLKSNSAERI